jgi:ankyrin repeat protein
MNSQMREACGRGDVERVLDLLTAGASPDEPLDGIGTTPLMAAASPALVDLLLDAGASLHPTRFGHDALQVVVSDDESAIENRSNRLLAAQRLIGAGAPLDLRDGHGRSRLYVAAFAGDVGAVETLLALGADPDDDPPPLAAACWGSGDPTGNSAQIIDLLVAAGADVHRRDDGGWTLLHAAAMPYSHGSGFESSDGANPSAMGALIRHGVPVDVAGPGGTTALMLVASDGALAAMQDLLAAGCDPEMRDHAGQRAVDRARAREERLTEILAEAESDTAPAVAAACDRVRSCIDRLSAR